MIKIRINGRGGQGGKTMAELMATMYFGESGEGGSFACVSASPTFGPERRGAPVDAYVRLSRERIVEQGPFGDPNMVIVLDPTLIETTDVSRGLCDGGMILINTPKPPEYFSALSKRFAVSTVDANAIALAHGLGTRGMPIVNTALLGAFVRASGLGSIGILAEFIGREIKKKTEANKATAQEAFDAVRTKGEKKP